MLDLPVALAYARESPSAYAVAAQLPSEDVLAAALPKGSENLEAVDSGIRALMSDGTIDRLAREWLHTSVSEGQDEQVAGAEDRTVTPLHLQLAGGALVDLSSPKGAPWEFLVVFGTLLLGPILIERARIPGIIGLLLGG